MYRFRNLQPLNVVKGSKKLAILATSLFCTHALALPEQCFQSTTRVRACGHMTYKKVVLEGEQAKVVCICLEDFEDIRVPASDEIGIAKQKYAIRKYSAELGLSEEALLKLVR